MTSKQGRFIVKPSVAAVRCALVALAIAPAAFAADADPADAAKQSGVVSVGGGYVSQDSAKFGEYNGLDKKGGYGIVDFDVRGRADDGADWKLIGRDLGLDTRRFTADYGRQGSFAVNFGYEGIVHNTSDTYQTPYQGLGGNNFTLPANWVSPRVPQASTTNANFRALSPGTGLGPTIVNGVSTPPTAAQQALVNSMIANDVPAFHGYDVSTKRDRYDGGFTYALNTQWQVKGSVRHEDKSGAKLMGAVTSQAAENAVILPDPIDQSTDQFRLSLDYTGAKGFFSVAYYGSLFKNKVQSFTWQDAEDLTKTATMSSAPDNQYHRINMTGGYRFSPGTKLVLDAAFARNTQDQAFVTAGQNNQFPLGVPVQNLDGLVVTKSFNAKFNSRVAKEFDVVAAYKYDDRDNRTAIHTYVFQDVNEARQAAASPFNAALGLAPNTLGSNINIYNNRPYSKTLNQGDLEGVWRLNPNHSLDAGYRFQKIDRDCTGSWIDCADANTTKENTLRLEWKGRYVDTLGVRVSYEYAERRVDNYNENAFLALVPMANVLGAGGAATSGTTNATMSALAYMIANGITGYGPLAGYSPPYTGNTLIYGNNGAIIPQALYGSRNNINELPGMRRFNMADRNRDKVRGLLNWEASDKVSLQAGGDYNKDDYENSVFGLKAARSYSLNFEGTYAVGDDLAASLWYTYEDINSRTAGDAYGANSSATSVNGFTAIDPVLCYATVAARNLNGKQDPCLQWNTNMKDKVDSLGFTVRKTGLMGGKLRIWGDLAYTRQTTDIDVTGGSYTNNPLAVAGAPASTAAALYLMAQPLPTVVVKITSLQLRALYDIDRTSSIGFMYMYGHMDGNDWSYTGMQIGTGNTYIPTNERFPSYNVNVFGLAYSYRFR